MPGYSVNIRSAIRPIARTIRRATLRAPQTVAAVDLGSNSFHMIVARVLNGQLHVVDRLQEMVRLAAGLDERNRLSRDAQERALACLERFGQRLRGLAPGGVRAVGTSTLRRARGVDKFLATAERALGQPIEVISGQEEARLIYQGVAQNLPADERARLVVDIGGGSTELILGQGLEPLLLESLHIGCVGASMRYFPDGKLGAKAWRRAETAARLEVKPVEAQFRARGWHSSYGASGTIRAIAAVIQAQGWDAAGGITLESLYRLRDALLTAKSLESLKLSGLSAERAPVFPGGVAILTALFEALPIERLEVSEGALREGLLHDLLGRLREQDVRARTIAALSERYHVDLAQAERVARTAQQCFLQTAPAWEIGEDYQHALGWAARLHEIGLAIAHNKYHKHGAYLAQHSDLQGFSYQEQRLLAVLIRGHRRRFPIEVFKELPKPQARIARRLCVLLRLAVLLHRGRAETETPRFRLEAGPRLLRVQFARGWLGKNPLTCADLAREADYLKAAMIRLEYA
jgi:exopolyphosphatase/guanosine-5'-triphosphate,3'-diphosphate pyrophosphatase